VVHAPAPPQKKPATAPAVAAKPVAAPKPAAPPPAATAAPAPVSAHECLIEPQQRIEIRSPINALIDKVLVERGSVVRAGDVLVQLDASVEREALAGARQRAQQRRCDRAGQQGGEIGTA
jgi:multidrug efflux pump subunit AcrA (membrane-fusion protein)